MMQRIRMPRALQVPLLACVLLLSGGCFLQKKAVVRVPVAPLPAAAPAPVATPPVAPPPVAAAPTPHPPAPATQPAKPSPFPAVTPPRPAAAAPRPAPIAPTPVPTLGAILTVDQRKQLDTAYQSDLRQANAVLASLSGHALSPDQADTVSRARAFIRQAGQFHDRDLTTAAQLAHNARVLTQNLAGALK